MQAYTRYSISTEVRQNILKNSIILFSNLNSSIRLISLCRKSPCM